MSADEIDAAIRRVVSRRPALAAALRVAAGALAAGGGAGAIHQATLQEFLWWDMPRTYPRGDWDSLADAVTELLEELGLTRLAGVARSRQTAVVLAAWDNGPEPGVRAFRRARRSSGVEPPDTSVLAWGSVMGGDEASAHEAIERALGRAVGTGALEPGTPRWRAVATAITEKVLTQPLENPPGQSYAGLVATERVAHWIDSAGDPVLGAWRARVANGLLNPIEPPPEPGRALAPIRWLLERAAAGPGVELTPRSYLARSAVLEAAERFGWWNRPKPPRSEVDVAELVAVHGSVRRLGLVRRRGRRLCVTVKGARLLRQPAALWRAAAVETGEGEVFVRAVAELVGIRLVMAPVDPEELAVELVPVLGAEGWRRPDGPLGPEDVRRAILRSLRWWGVLDALDEVEPAWDEAGTRRLTPHLFALRPDGVRLVLAFLRQRAAGPRHRPGH